MRKIIITFLVLIFSVFIYSTTFAQEEQTIRPIFIDSLIVRLDVTESGKVWVNEKFNVSSFGENISTFYWTINSKRVTQLNVKNGGRAFNSKEYKISKKGSKTILSDFDFTSQVSEFSTSSTEWEISYLLNHSIKVKNYLDELRYEIKPDGASINNTEILVNLPKDFNSSELKPIYYAIHGASGVNSQVVGSKSMLYKVQSLGPFSIFTIIPSWPKGAIVYSGIDKIYNFFSSASGLFWLGIGLFLPFATFLIMFIMIITKKIQENIKPSQNLFTQPPLVIDPAALGVLYRETVGPREIAATLIDLAQRGYLLIVNNGEGRYGFGTRRTSEGMAPHELSLYKEIFGGSFRRTIGDIMELPQEQIFSDTISKIYKQIYEDVARLGYFKTNPEIVHLRYKILGIILFFISVAGFFSARSVFTDLPYLLFAFFGMALASLVIIRMSQKLPMRTKKGQDALGQWLSFREVLKKYKQNISYNEIFQETFIKYLPYAIVLNIEGKWASHFINIPFKIPDWYTSRGETGILSGFTQDLYPLIDYVASLMQSLKEPEID